MPKAPTPAGTPNTPGGPHPRGRALLWGTGGLMLLMAVAVVLLLPGLVPHSPGTTGAPAGTAVEPGINAAAATLLQLDPQSQPQPVAPALSLTDQNGKHVSLSDYHGKSVVLSFNDDKCQDLCTLLAQDVVAANKDLGAHAKDVVFLSVNANPYYPSTPAIKEWTDSHGLAGASNWVFATGSPPELAKAAASYGVPVELDPRTRSVVHGTELFFIDPAGKEAALGQFGTESASTDLYAHAMAQAAVNLLPDAAAIHVGGPSPAATASQTAASINAAAPAFTLPQLTRPQSTTSLGAFKGKVTVVNFWSSTCTACVAEMPAMEQAFKALGNSTNFVGIDVADNPRDAAAFAAKYGTTYPLLSDGAGTASGAYQVPGLPFTAVIGTDGTLLVRHPGAMTAEQLEYVLQSLIQGGS
ncbi:redoxin domain-containing protein [Arthrobacter wenxiniae]|uniref:Redoxin domain-containing protein n=1 Tax=Arthrobacter wenxiniae TaxID=2713570 RepID=A0A7Y7M1S1_9MICC|nr:redoxin domain-containing protein [Arthrobacter wenxiniae]NVM96956.1 redoxin domain-containing protein [Arthrobacter wenxiniae]